LYSSRLCYLVQARMHVASTLRMICIKNPCGTECRFDSDVNFVFFSFFCSYANLRCASWGMKGAISRVCLITKLLFGIFLPWFSRLFLFSLLSKCAIYESSRFAYFSLTSSIFPIVNQFEVASKSVLILHGSIRYKYIRDGRFFFRNGGI